MVSKKRRLRRGRLYRKTGSERWYADFRDLNGKQEALIPPGKNRATVDYDEAIQLFVDRLHELKTFSSAEKRIRDFGSYLTVQIENVYFAKLRQPGIGEMQEDELVWHIGQEKIDCVYVAQDIHSGCFKIGHSERPFDRVKSINTPYPLAMVMMILGGGGYVESIVHGFLDSHRVQREWFSESALDDLIKLIHLPNAVLVRERNNPPKIDLYPHVVR